MRISVAMCTYNGSRFLPEQLASIMAQTRLPDEVIVCDDGSTDSTLQLIDDFRSRAPFSVRLLINECRLGSTKNFEKCIQECNGDLIVLSDQDDSWYSDRLQATEIAMIQNPGAGILFTDADAVDDDLKPLGYRLWDRVYFNHRLKRLLASGRGFEALLTHNVVTGATMAFRAEFRSLILPIPSLWVQDGWIALLISAVSNVVCVDQPLVKYRQHASQQLGAAKSTIRGHLANTQRDFNYKIYQQMPMQYIEVRTRLHDNLGPFLPHSVEVLLQAKIQHMRHRAELSKTHIPRLFRVALELIFLRYRRFGYGWRGAVRDLLVRFSHEGQDAFHELQESSQARTTK